MALPLRPRIDFGSRASAMIAVARELGLPITSVPAQSIANSHRTYLKFINLCRTAVGLPVYTSMDYSNFVPALNAILATAGATTKPEIITAPVITGTPSGTNVLTCSSGVWSNTAGISYAYQWKRDNSTVVGSNSANYTLQGAADSGHTIMCTVTATNAQGAGTPALSNFVNIA